MTAEELVGLLELSKGLLVRLLGAQMKLPSEVVDRLAPIPPLTRGLLLQFGEGAAQYLPAINATAPIVGAAAFAALAFLDLHGTWRAMRRERDAHAPAPAVEAAPRASAAAPGAARASSHNGSGGYVPPWERRPEPPQS